MNTDLMFSSNTDKWFTPTDLYKSLGDMFNFVLDPCPANPVVDGLSIPGNVCTYVNPPYGKDIINWVRKAHDDSKKYKSVIVMLLPARTDTKWWQEYAMKANEVWLIRGRLKFGGHKNAAPFPSAIVIFNGAERLTKIQFKCVNKVGLDKGILVGYNLNKSNGGGSKMIKLPKRYKKLTRARFEQWLREVINNGNTVTFTRSRRGCPIARYLDATYPHKDHLVSRSCFTVEGVFGKIKLPKWASVFVDR